MKCKAWLGVCVGVLESADYANVTEGTAFVLVEYTSMRCDVRFASAKYAFVKCEVCEIVCYCAELVNLVSLIHFKSDDFEWKR